MDAARGAQRTLHSSFQPVRRLSLISRAEGPRGGWLRRAHDTGRLKGCGCLLDGAVALNSHPNSSVIQ